MNIEAIQTVIDDLRNRFNWEHEDCPDCKTIMLWSADAIQFLLTENENLKTELGYAYSKICSSCERSSCEDCGLTPTQEVIK